MVVFTSLKTSRLLAATLFLAGSLLGISFLYAEPSLSSPPPIAQNLVREGDFALKLYTALSGESAEDEIEAESRLGEMGVTPKNGWIADYPVTPDIMHELENSIVAATGTGTLSLDKETALKKLDQVKADTELTLSTTSSSQKSDVSSPDPVVINNYYYDNGPPIVTYYEPPAVFFSLYAWIPSPFWWFSYPFSGYYILNDFHRILPRRGEVAFISNHYNDHRHRRVYRVDPITRYRGKTYAGIGAPRSRQYLDTGVRGGSKTIFNNRPVRRAPQRDFDVSGRRTSDRSAPGFSPGRGNSSSPSGTRGGGGGMEQPPTRRR